MVFRRVFIATALVAVLASSLFSGWLSSAVLRESSIAQAADTPGCTFADANSAFDTNPTAEGDQSPVTITQVGNADGTSKINIKLSRLAVSPHRTTSGITEIRSFEYFEEPPGGTFGKIGDIAIAREPDTGTILTTDDYFATADMSFPAPAKTGSNVEARLAAVTYRVGATPSTITISVACSLENIGPTVSNGSLLQVTGSTNSCSTTGIIGASGLNIGNIITNLIGCAVKYFVDSIDKPLQGFLCNAAKLSDASPSLLATTTRAQTSQSELKTQGDLDKDAEKNCAEGSVRINAGGNNEDANIGDFERELITPGSTVNRIWRLMMGVVNVVVILALLAIAFANILHLNINTYTAKKALPALVIGVIGANASMFLIRFLADITNAVSIWAVEIARHDTSLLHFISVDFTAAIGRAAIGPLALTLLLGPFFLIIAFILIVYYFYLICIFIYALFKRIIILYFLTAVAPLAFVAYGIPNFQQYFTKWWNMLLRHLFLYPVILFGMALTIILADAVGINSLAAGAFSTPGIFGMILVLAAATMVLKLPNIITKGTIDVADAAKKAWGLARQAPISATGSMGNWRSAQSKKLKGLALNETDPDRRAALLARSKKAGDRARGWSTWRGRANIAANPQQLKAWYDARAKREESNTSIDTLSSKGKKIFRGSPLSYLYPNADIPTPEIVKGRRAAMGEKENGALDRFKKGAAEFRGKGDPVAIAKQARQYSDRLEMFRAIRAKLGADFDPDHMSAEQQEFIASIPQAAISDVYMERLEDKIGVDPQNPGRLPGVEAMAHVANNWAAAQETVRQLMGPNTPRASLIRETYKAMMQGFDAYDTAASRDRPEELPNTGLYNNPPNNRNPIGGPTNSVQKVYVTNPTTLQDPRNEALFNKLAEHTQNLLDTLGSEKLVAHVNSAGGDMDKLLSGEIGEAIKGQIGHLVSEGSGELVSQIVGAAASGGDVSNLRALIARGEIIDQTGQAMTNEASQFSDEQLNRLAEKVGSSTSEAVQSLTGVLTPYMKNLGITDPKILNAYGQKVIDGFREVMSQGPKSMRANLESQFSKLMNTIAQDQGLQNINPSSLASAIAKAEVQQPAAPTPQTNTTNVTNVNNIETAPPPPASTEAPEPPANS